MNNKKKMAIIIDIPNWAFHSMAKLMEKELSNYVEIDIFSMHIEPYNDNLFMLLEDIKNYDYIHFLWRKHLLLFKSEQFKQDLMNANINYDEYLNYFTPKITTAVCDHMFLSDEEIELYEDVFNKFSKKYYTISQKLDNIYKSIKSYKNPDAILNDTFDKNVFRPQNLNRFNFIDITKPLTIGWVGNSAWNNKDGNGFDYKGLHTVLEPVLEELISEGFNIKKLYADKQINFIPHDEMPNYFKDIDIYITCSYQEGTPLPVLEAMSCGVPVIATDVGVVPEVFGTLQKEFIIGDRTKLDDSIIKQNLKKAIIKLYNNRDLLKKLSGENISRSYLFDSTTLREKYIKFFFN